MAATSSEYLQYLPQTLRASPSAGVEPFLGRFLKIFEALLSGRDDALPPGHPKVVGLEEILDRLIDVLDPAFTPVAATDGRVESPFLTYLASWVALTLDQNWDLDKQRRWLQQIVPLYRRRGTRAGLGRYLAMFVGSQVQIDEPPGGFVLGVADSSTVGLDTYIAGAPAYYFRVRIPYAFGSEPFDIAVWRNIRSGTRTIIDLEKPAHTYYTLDARTPGIILGFKLGQVIGGNLIKGRATVGQDTLIWQNSKPI